MRILLLLDWDGTLTPSSTLPHVARICPNVSDNVLEPFTSAYMNDYARHVQLYKPAKSERTTLTDELAYLESLCPIEAASVHRLEQGKLWEGLKQSNIQEAGQRIGQLRRNDPRSVELRKGTRSLADRVRSEGGKVSIVSVNWSATWVAAVLRAKGVDAPHGIEKAPSGTSDIFVYANEIDPHGSGMLSRGLPTDEGGLRFDCDGEGLWTAGHKSKVLKKVVQTITATGDDWLTVYVGDSSTDLGCLEEADIGICIRDEELSSEQRSLQETLQRVGLKCENISTFSHHGHEKSKSRKQLYWSKDFQEIENLLFEQT